MRVLAAAVCAAALAVAGSGCGSGVSTDTVTTVGARPTSTASIPPTLSPAPGEPTLPPASDEPFVSSEYGYEVTLPEGWTATPATQQWDGGDVDHTANYADRFVAPDGTVVFALGLPVEEPLERFADEHAAWLVANRGCPEPSTREPAVLAGRPAVRLAFHCPDGIFGPTLVLKAVAVEQGRAVILTSFSPDTTGTDSLPTFESLLSSVRWGPPTASD